MIDYLRRILLLCMFLVLAGCATTDRISEPPDNPPLDSQIQQFVKKMNITPILIEINGSFADILYSKGDERGLYLLLSDKQSNVRFYHRTFSENDRKSLVSIYYTNFDEFDRGMPLYSIIINDQGIQKKSYKLVGVHAFYKMYVNLLRHKDSLSKDELRDLNDISNKFTVSELVNNQKGFIFLNESPGFKGFVLLDEEGNLVYDEQV